GELADLDFSAGEESLEVRLFHEADIPWDELAFPTVGKTLKQYFIDRQQEHYPVHMRDITYRPGQTRR
ncbi:MAG TPA: NUDIX hydrolase, partial [Pseudomonas sp.]|nr:NUDIX hydrolase [Pseudomonas sp.]